MDIETLPSDVPFEEKVAWDTGEEYRATALNGMFGRLLCIGYIDEPSDGSPLKWGCLGWREASGDFEPSEKKILSEWWELVADFNPGRDLMIGHNILGFDLPFIIQRSIVQNVRPSVKLPMKRFQDAPIYDTLQMWKFWGGQGGPSSNLGNLSIALGLESPKEQGIAGDKVYDAYLEGRFRELYEYCMRDVKATRNVYRRMNFTYPVEGEE